MSGRKTAIRPLKKAPVLKADVLAFLQQAQDTLHIYQPNALEASRIIDKFQEVSTGEVDKIKLEVSTAAGIEALKLLLVARQPDWPDNEYVPIPLIEELPLGMLNSLSEVVSVPELQALSKELTAKKP